MYDFKLKNGCENRIAGGLSNTIDQVNESVSRWYIDKFLKPDDVVIIANTKTNEIFEYDYVKIKELAEEFVTSEKYKDSVRFKRVKTLQESLCKLTITTCVIKIILILV